VKVIFIEDVPKVARAGQTKVVADGYARNYLFRRKLAVLADSGAAVAVEAHLKKIVKQKAIEEAEMAALAKQITGTEITLKAKVGENDRLYGSVTGADIAAELGKAIGREIDKRRVDLAEPIRQVGVYDVTIRFIREITATVVVIVMSDAEGAAVPVRVEKKAEEPAEKAEKKEKKPKAEKKAKTVEGAEEKTEKAVEPAKDAVEVKEEKPAKEKKEKKAKAPKAEESEEKEEKAAKKEEKVAKKEEKASAIKEEKPPKEKKAKAPKAEKEVKPAEEEKKEKKPRAEKKAKKSEPEAE
jgi:large subunit ribosomal protein L9